MAKMPEETVQNDQAEIVQRTERLRQAVNQAGGQTVVGRRAKMPPTSVGNYLAGRDMKVAALVALAEACDVSLEWLATGAGNMKNANRRVPAWAEAFGEALDQPANFYVFCLLLSSCQEYYTRLGVPPSLAEAFEWVAAPYTKGFSTPDRPIVLATPSS